MNKLLQGISFVFLSGLNCCMPGAVDAQYKISGQLKNYDSLWLNRISVSAIDSLKHLNYATPNYVINKDSMDKEGYFTISGNSLPDEDMIYRLDLTNQKNSIAMLSNDNHIFLILNNHSAVKIYGSNFSKNPFDYRVEGSDENASLQKLGHYVAGLRKLFSAPGSQSHTGEAFAENRFTTDIRNYCDTCKYAIVALMGIYEIDNLGKDCAGHPDFYNHFLSRIKSLPGGNSVYVKEFEERINLLSGGSGKENLSNIMIITEGILIIFLLGVVWYLKNKLKQTKRSNAGKAEPGELFETLTRREKEILALLIEDSPNKDIAAKLNLEVSTIKTHIGKIYQKLAISNRNEVKAYEQFLRNRNGLSY